MNQEETVEENFSHKTIELATEWSKLLLSNEALERQVPNDALIVFQIEGEISYNTQSMTLAKASHLREPERPILFVRVKGLTPPLVSRLIDPHLEVATKL